MYKLAVVTAVLSLLGGCADILGFEPGVAAPQLTGQGDAASATKDAGVATPGSAQAEPPLVEQTPCQALCDVVMAACKVDAETGVNYAVYDSKLTCLRECDTIDIGEAGAETGNTVSCRMTNAQIARDFAGERSSACPAAGPGGDGICGTNCAGYCSQMAAFCPAEAVMETDADAGGESPGFEHCMEQCGSVPDLGGFNVSQTTGDSVQCRLYHLGAAIVSPINHCPHAAGASPCASDVVD